MIHSSSRPGYVFLITVLFIGAIAIATTVSLLLLGWAAEQNGDATLQAAQALWTAEGCLREGTRRLTEHPALEYTGSSSILYGATGSCSLVVRGTGNMDRILCAAGYASGISGLSTRRLILRLKRIVPLIVDRQEEVVNDATCFPAASSSSS